MNRPDFDKMSSAETKQFRQFVNLDLRKAMKRCMPEEMAEMREQDIKEKNYVI